MWEEVIAYFPLIQYGPHRKRCLQQFFVAVGTSLTSCYLATVGRDRLIHTREYNNSSILACIRCRRNVFTQPLPSNERKDIQIHRLIGWIHEERRWDVIIKIDSGFQMLTGKDSQAYSMEIAQAYTSVNEQGKDVWSQSWSRLGGVGIDWCYGP